MTTLHDACPLNESCEVVSYNLHCTRLATAASPSRLSIHHRSTSDPLWRLAAVVDDVVQRGLRQDETIVALDWVNPQYGDVVAAGTSQGRVLLLSQRPLAGTSTSDAAGAAADMDTGQSQSAGWQLDHVLLDGQQLKRTTDVRSLAFSPPGMELTLAVAHSDGRARLLTCTAQHPLSPHARWTCAHVLDPSAAAATARSRPGGVAPPSGPSAPEGASACVSCEWQPQPDEAAPCLVLATEARASLWCYNRWVMDWACTCADLEAAAGGETPPGAVSCVRWAPLVGRSAELVAVARGAVVRVLALEGDLLSVKVEQVGPELTHGTDVWKLDWSAFALEMAASCEAAPSMPPSVSVWRMNLEGSFGPKPAVVISGGALAADA